VIGLDSRLIAEVTYYTAAIPAASKSSNKLTVLIPQTGNIYYIYTKKLIINCVIP